MGGRNAKPIYLHLANGNKRHLTNREIEDRKKHEAKLKSGVKSFQPSQQVKDDAVALSMFRKVKRLYKNIEYVEGLDENIINRYCLLHSEYVNLRDMRQGLVDRCSQIEDLAEKIAMADTLSEIDRRLEKKMDMLLKLEDRLFLNPTARLKNVPKKEDKPPRDPLVDKGFGNV